jgi:MinD-like ATPase involved in chromosome partitioning or flagellar assembly
MATYVFANPKGGVGKTTITLGVAAALAARGARVLLIDLDPQASATKVLGVDVRERCTMADALLEPERFSLSDAIARGRWGLDVAPAEMALASRESRRSTADEFVLRNQLDRITGYEVVLVDCPPSLGVLTLNALAAASHLVVVTEPSFLALQDGSEEEATFLATQQVDEARHMQFYARFQDEVVADPAVIADHVARAREQLSAAFATVFDVGLVQAHERLLADPAYPAAKVAFVTTYHLVIESTLGLTAFRFITRYLEREGLLPGFVEGYSRIHHDEQRHMGYGVWYSRDAVERDPALADEIRGTLGSLLPAVADSLTPPDRDGTDWDALGASAGEIREFALGGLTRRLTIIGVELG